MCPISYAIAGSWIDWYFKPMSCLAKCLCWVWLLIFSPIMCVSGLCKQNNSEEAIKMLASMEELGCRPDLTTYNTILGARCGSGELNLARKMLKNMKFIGVKLNSQTYEVLIVACHDSHEIDEACL